MPMDFPNSPTLNQTVNLGSKRYTWTGEQWAAANSTTGLNVQNSPTIDLSWNSSTNTLSADFNSSATSYNKTYDAYYNQTTAITWATAMAGFPPKIFGGIYAWPGGTGQSLVFSSRLQAMQNDSYTIQKPSAIFLTHNLVANYDGGSGLIDFIQMYDYSLSNGSTWIRNLSANSGSVAVINQYGSSGTPFDNAGNSLTGTCLLTAGIGTNLKIRPTFLFGATSNISVTNFVIYGSITITIQDLL